LKAAPASQSAIFWFPGEAAVCDSHRHPAFRVEDPSAPSKSGAGRSSFAFNPQPINKSEKEVIPLFRFYLRYLHPIT
jgi:hypothetical protein